MPQPRRSKYEKRLVFFARPDQIVALDAYVEQLGSDRSEILRYLLDRMSPELLQGLRQPTPTPGKVR